MSLSFCLSVTMKITTEGVLSVFVCEEIGVIVIPLLLQRTSRKTLRLQPKATWVDVSKACV